MKINFLEVAQLELDEAVAYYNYELSGLGDVFLADALKALDRIAAVPEAWYSFSARTRRCLLRRFPYAIIYQIREAEILVVAVAHQHRGPHYWENRLSILGEN